ncbi:hypothetical protein AWZ03_012184 [Drosophila navojoa]|uniref:Ribosomal protein L15 n=1 Tax=Drosophila navojoa TaxID=7232 RepID=A0A484AY97_DRONA|nr:60S ribosomal protein L15-like [Drosophila navojoa]TDG41393.1 hypothetical protein AWZ03_012184 [Drosophila navojoa]
MRYYIRIRVWLCTPSLKLRCAHGLCYPQKTLDDSSHVVFRIRIRGARRHAAHAKNHKCSRSLGNTRRHFPILQRIIEERIRRPINALRLVNAQWIVGEDNHHYYEIILIDLNANRNRKAYQKK